MCQLNSSRQRGFNLIEAAIVLGVIGLVIGGIWVAASAVSSRHTGQETAKDILVLVQNAVQAKASGMDLVGMNADGYLAMGYLPKTYSTTTPVTRVRSSSTGIEIYNAGGNLTLCGPPNTAVGQCLLSIRLNIDKLSHAACVELASQIFKALAPIHGDNLWMEVYNNSDWWGPTGTEPMDLDNLGKACVFDLYRPMRVLVTF